MLHANGIRMDTNRLIYFCFLMGLTYKEMTCICFLGCPNPNPTDMLSVWNFHTNNLCSKKSAFCKNSISSNYFWFSYENYFHICFHTFNITGTVDIMSRLFYCVCVFVCVHVTEHTSSVTHGWSHRFSLSSTVGQPSKICFKLNMHDLFDLSLPYEIAWLPE